MTIQAGPSFIYIFFYLVALLSIARGERRVGLHIPALSRVNLTIDFKVPPGPIVEPQSRPSDVPIVSHGVMWSNLVDRAWHFGGKSEMNTQLQNSLWRFEPGKSDTQWTSIDVSYNISRVRPSNGAGCNAPDIQTGFYLGGTTVSDDAASPGPQFLHLLTVFDMQTETLSSLEVPSFVPVVNQSVVFLNTGNKEGVLVVLGG